MYACICHALRERDVEEAISLGACRVSEIYRYFGVKPQCGRCLSTVRHILVAHHGSMHSAHRSQVDGSFVEGSQGEGVAHSVAKFHHRSGGALPRMANG